MRAQFQKLHQLDDNAFYAYSYEMEEFDAPWHYHPEFELTYIISSTGVRYVGNSLENFSAGDLVLVGPNLPHCWKNTGVNNEKAAAIVIQWNDHLYPTDWLKHDEFDGIKNLLDRSSKGVRFHNASQYFNKMIRLLELPPFQKFVAFLEILNELSTEGSGLLCETGFGLQPDHEDHERVNKVYGYVRKHFMDKITLADMAAEIHMTEESFSRFFSKLMRKPFFTFLNEYRINAASKMLIETENDVTQVAFGNGFESLPFFYRQFKRYKGKSPGQFREMYRRLVK